MSSFRRQIQAIQVGKQMLILDVYINDATTTNIKDQTSEVNHVEKNTRQRSCEWFEDFHVDELLKSVATDVAARVCSGKPVTRVTRQHLATSKNVTTQNLKIQYCFKKWSVAANPHALLKKDNYNYDSLPIFHEKLVVTVWQNMIEKEQQTINFQVQENAIDKEFRTSETSSSYFAETTDCLTSSVKRKKKSLKKIAKKSRIALLESQPVNESPETSTQEQTDGDSPSTIVNSNQINSDQQKKKTFIDLEKIPKGLNIVRRVEDLRPDHLKFLINKMEQHLRTIFCGEVYSRRHEDYKKGGKSRDNLNFQVGMAHFTEDQHDCIMEALMAIFCSKHIKYIDYVTKVIFPEALMKLYKDVHQTTMEQAEVRLLNDTC